MKREDGGVEEGGRNEEVLGGGRLTGGRLCFCLMAVGSPAFLFLCFQGGREWARRNEGRQGVGMKEAERRETAEIMEGDEKKTRR